MANRIFTLSVSVLGLLLIAGQVFAQESFYKNKTLRMIVGTSAGGGFDAYTRTLAATLANTCPDNPILWSRTWPGPAI